MLSDFIKIGLKNLMQRKLRTLLTMAGIVIGVAAIISLMSVGQGLDSSINAQFEKIGTNRVFVTSKAGGLDPSSSADLTTDDSDVLKSMSEFDFVVPYYSQGSTVTFGQEEQFVARIMGIEVEKMEESFETFDVTMEKGRYFTPGDKNVLVIGAKVVDSFFDKDVRLGSNLKINDKKFRVVGILSTIGNPDDDTVMYMPLETAQDLFGGEDKISFIDAQIKPTLDVNAVVDKAFRRLEKSRGDDLFEISTADQLLAQANTIVGLLNAVLVAIAGISLLVGGLGIMNSMFTSVLERTREIGIMKAIGAKKRDILLVFVLEAALISGVGGIIGSTIGLAFGQFVSFAAQQGGYEFLQIAPSPGLFAFGVGFALFVGIISGILPAKQATEMHVVDALRS